MTTRSRGGIDRVFGELQIDSCIIEAVVEAVVGILQELEGKHHPCNTYKDRQA